MKQILQQQRTGQLGVYDVPAPALQPQGILVANAYSLVSAGTERAKVSVAKKSLLGKALARPDQVRKVLAAYRSRGFRATVQQVRSRLETHDPLGYSSAGIVIAVGSQVSDLRVGDRVACAGGGYANHAEIVYVPETLASLVPDGLALSEATYATLGAIALQGIRQAAPTLGETVAVIGLGLVGLLTVQLLKANGCRVIGLDIDPERCRLGMALGADIAGSPDDPGTQTEIWRRVPTGLDAVILAAATRSSGPVRLAAELSRDKGRVVVVGDVGLDIPRGPFFEREVDLLFARSYGPGRYDPSYEEKGRDYPIGYVRWTEGRNLAAFLDLQAQGKIDTRSLTTHTIEIDQAEKAYDLILGKSQEASLGVLLDYALNEDALPAPAAELVQVAKAPGARNRQGLALIGAGNFVQAFLLPELKARKELRLQSVITTSGRTARSVAERYGFQQCGSDPQLAFEDPQVHLVLIGTRHDSHSELAASALRAGKAVFVEKPLALSHEGLDAVSEAYAAAAAPFLMVGFNRRFAPLVQVLKSFFGDEAGPRLMNYRINAGYIPRDHWVQDPEIGGGRILGEVCHFVDLLSFVAGAAPVEVYGRALPDQGRYSQDNLIAELTFADGSLGTITYAANGDPAVNKERLEVFAGGRAALLDDFKELSLAHGRIDKHKATSDKGHRAEMQALVTASASGKAEPVPFREALSSSRATVALAESVQSGMPVKVALD
jgi:polar amino acid transport system substrate-binding protein